METLLTPEEFSKRFDIPLDDEARQPQAIQVTPETIASINLRAASLLEGPSDPDEESDPVSYATTGRRPKSRLSRVGDYAFRTFMVYALFATGSVAWRQFKSSDCIKPVDNTELQPPSKDILGQVDDIDFVENDMERLTRIQEQLDEAKTLTNAKDIAKKYLKDRGLTVKFDQLPTISLDRVYSLNPFHSFDMVPSMFNETDRIRAVKGLVSNFAATPRKLLTMGEPIEFFVPDRYKDTETEGESGIAFHDSPFVPLIGQQPFIIYSLDSFVDTERGFHLFNHEVFHELDSEECKPIESDDTYREFNPDWFDYNLWGQEQPEIDMVERAVKENVIPSYYSTVSTKEDKAETFAEVMDIGLSPARTQRGRSPMDKKARLLITRTIALTHLNELPALIELRRLYGASIHPKQLVDMHYAPFLDLEWQPLYMLNLTKQLVLDSPKGRVIFWCDEPNVQHKSRPNNCAVGITNGDPAMRPADRQKDWYVDILSQLTALAEQVMGTKHITNHSGIAAPGSNFPQNEKAEFLFTRDR